MLKNIIIGALALAIAAIAYHLHDKQIAMADLVRTNQELQIKLDDQQVHILSIDSTGGSTTTTVLVSDMASGAPVNNITIAISTPDASGHLVERERGVTNVSGVYHVQTANTIGGDIHTVVKVLKGAVLLTQSEYVSHSIIGSVKFTIKQ